MLYLFGAGPKEIRNAQNATENPKPKTVPRKQRPSQARGTGTSIYRYDTGRRKSKETTMHQPLRSTMQRSKQEKTQVTKQTMQEETSTMKTRITLIPIIAALTLSGALTATATSISVRPDHDGWTEDGQGVQDHIGNQAYGSNAGRQAYLKFDISSLGSGKTITSAILTMRTRNDFTIDSFANVYSVADDSWDETTLEDSNEPAIGPQIGTFDIEGTVSLGVDPGTSQLDNIDVTAWVTSNYNSLDNLISVGIIEPGNGITFYRGDEHADQSEHPWAELTVTGVPEPTTLALLGLSGLALLRARRASRRTLHTHSV
jgi:hypothetical protein